MVRVEHAMFQCISQMTVHSLALLSSASIPAPWPFCQPVIWQVLRFQAVSSAMCEWFQSFTRMQDAALFSVPHWREHYKGE